MTKARKITKVEYCDRHRFRFLSERVDRRMEVMVEGGWAHGGACAGGCCRLWPGRDYFVAEICSDEYALDWVRG